jgi:hypothetical protein
MTEELDAGGLRTNQGSRNEDIHLELGGANTTKLQAIGLKIIDIEGNDTYSSNWKIFVFMFI